MSSTYQKILNSRDLTPDQNWLQINTIDMHTGGEPLRVILNGFPELKGTTVLEYREDCKARHDHLRKALLLEPRGHADMYGCLLTPPNDEGADFGVLFLHNEGYSTMCGHAVIALGVLAVKMSWMEIKEGENTLTIDAPCGRIHVFIEVDQGVVQGVRFHCVPSFVVGLEKEVRVPGFGKVVYDLAYGGAFYAYVDLRKNKLDLDLEPTSYQGLIQAGKAIKKAVAGNDKEIVHPYEPALSFLYGTIFIDASKHGFDSKNVCIFADGEVDRCPTGSGVSGRMAIHYARGEMAIGERHAVESITGSVFKGSIVKTLEYGPYNAVVPQVEGTAYITGMHTFLFDPEDPVKEGFLLR